MRKTQTEQHMWPDLISLHESTKCNVRQEMSWSNPSFPVLRCKHLSISPLP